MRAEPLVDVRPHDREFYAARLRDFLPARLIDVHTHVYPDRLKAHAPGAGRRVVSWPERVARDNPVEDLVETYRVLLPGQRVTPLMFSSVAPGDDIDALNGYVRDAARRTGFPALIFAHPSWDAATFERNVEEGGFLGAKVYLSLAPESLPGAEIRIFDFLPPHQLAVLDRRGWIVMLHVPRPARLRDPENLRQILEIEDRYPGLHLILAHVGRAYCDEDVGNAFDVLKRTQRLVFDFSANTNGRVFARCLEAVGSRRLLFGTDLPILRMRMRRITEGGRYINLVPKGLYGDVAGDPNMREVDGAEAARLTFFLYEEIDAFRRAAEEVGLGRGDIEDCFCNNALRLLRAAGWAGAEG